MEKISGTYLKELRVKYGYSLRSLAEKLYVSKSTVDNWEKNDSLADEKLIQTLAQLYNIEVEEILSHSLSSDNAYEIIESCAVAQTEPESDEVETTESVNTETPVPKPKRKLRKIIFISVTSLIVIGLIVGICLTGIFAFNNSEGYSKKRTNDWGIKNVDLFVIGLVVLVIVVCVIVFFVLRRKYRAKRICENSGNSKKDGIKK